MKNLIKCVSLVLVVVLLLPTSVSALEQTESRSSKFFMRSSVYLYKTSDTTFQVWFDVTAVDTMEQIGASSIKVQKSSDGVNWTTMITYYKENNPSMIKYNSVFHSGCVSYIGSEGCYYRAVIVLTAKNSSGVGEVTEYTTSLLL